MQNKKLEAKAIDIKGKRYILVSDRILAFNEDYPNGSIQTEIVSDLEADRVIVRAIVTPDLKNPERKFSDFSQAVIGDNYINKTSALENASTSAVGRALAYMGIGVLDSIASVDEIAKAENAADEPAKTPNFKELFTKLVAAKTILEINAVQEDSRFNSLPLYEKKAIFDRMSKAVQNLKKVAND